MRKRLIIITKDPEFDERGEVVLGQCEPFTGNWKLILVNTDKSFEVLLTGTYSDLRKIQESCTSIDETTRVKARVEDMKKLLNAAATETVAMDDGRDLGVAATQQMQPLKLESMQKKEFTAQERADYIEKTTELMPAVKDDEESKDAAGDDVKAQPFFQVTLTEGALIALVSDPDRANDPILLNTELRKLLFNDPKSIVLDLGRLQNIAMRVAKEFQLFQEHCQDEGVEFKYDNVRKSVKMLMENLGYPVPQ